MFLSEKIRGERRSTVEYGLSVQMRREEEEIVDVALASLAAAIRLQRVGILEGLGAEFIDRNDVIVPEEEAPIGPLPEKLEDRSRRLDTVPVLRLDQEYRLAAFEQTDRAIENAEFVSFDVDLHECHILTHDRIQARDRNVIRHHLLSRRIHPRLERRQAMDQSVLTLRDEQIRFRSEERRVGKECRSRWEWYD